jgi:S-adenosylhomocysteine hydrolase
VAVEQTDRGIQVIEDMKQKGIELRCPVVNMARCDAKKIQEAPMIGESCVFNVEEELARMKVTVNPKRASIIGYGAVGKAVADRLRARGYEVWVYDIDPKRMAQAETDGCLARPREEVLQNASLLYGCTGKGPLTNEDYKLLPDGAVLCNAASGNHELGPGANALFGPDAAVHVEHGHAHTSFQGKDIDLGEAGSPMRHGVLRGKSGKQLLFMRSGYVVNMGRDIPPEAVQLIRGLLLASCLQAIREKKPGLVDVDASTQDFIVKRVDKALARFGISLLDPDFRKLPT